MANHYEGNFVFIKEEMPGVFEHLLKAEKQVRIDPEDAGQKLRKALENLTDELLIKNGERMFSDDTLRTKIDRLKESNLLPKDRSLYSYRSLEGNEAKASGLNLWRWLGNEASHDNSVTSQPRSVRPAVTYNNVITVLMIARNYLKKLKGSKKHEFNENLMPIADYYIIQHRIPSDAQATGCIREFDAVSYNELGEEEFSVLRLFAREENKEDMTRNFLAQFKAQRENGAFKGVSLQTISRQDTKEEKEGGEFYIEAYQFINKPFHLSRKAFGETGSKELYNVCKDVAAFLHVFHDLEKPIFHRNISRDCLYFCKVGEKLVPSIINFDYAKISGAKHTVRNRNLKNADNPQIEKYRAPEYRDLLIEGAEATDEDWRKADIYSLGILLADIVTINAKVETYSPEEFRRNNISEDFITLFMSMTAEDPEQRPADLGEVIAALDKIIRADES